MCVVSLKNFMHISSYIEFWSYP